MPPPLGDGDAVGRNPATFEKRRKEQERVENQKEKAKRRAERKESNRKESDQSRPAGDPDIDWIVPGPQPSSDSDDEP
jgi:hypothetical protein